MMRISGKFEIRIFMSVTRGGAPPLLKSSGDETGRHPPVSTLENGRRYHYVAYVLCRWLVVVITSSLILGSFLPSCAPNERVS